MRADQMPVAPPFDPDVDAFDPERAGFERVGRIYHCDSTGGSISTLVSDARITVTMEGEFGPVGHWFTCFCLPANLPHNIVLAILRANGREG